MLLEDKYFDTLSEDELWTRYCGFLDLSVDEFLDMQKELLMDQMDRVCDSIIFQKIMGNRKPSSLEEFRRVVPLTTYDDYEPYLNECQEDTIAIKPAMWCHSAGRGGRFKWIPLSAEFLDKATKNCLSTLILATAKEKGQVNISPGARFLLMLAPSPYVSGCTIQGLAERFSFQAIPNPEKTKGMEFRDRIQKGFQTALKDGVDVMGGLASILVKMGEEFGERRQGKRFSASMLHPKIMLRLLRAWVRCRRQKRGFLPKDLWPTKAIVTGGVDTAIYKDDIAYYWGSEPYEFYVCAEAVYLAIQSWNKKGMVFLPDMAFLEFIPYDEILKHEDDKGYQPRTVLLNELEEGKLYEVVITHLYGMPLLRYRMKDLIKVLALRDDETGVNLPHIVFQRRIGETINLGGLADLDEKTIWQAIANTGIKYREWAACKEYDSGRSLLRLYLEVKERKEAAEIATMVDEQLKIVDTDYKDIDSYLGIQPVRVTLLSPGTFERYMDEKRKEGADFAHIKPTHVNAPESVIKRLLQVSEVVEQK